ncbi:uncharacterized protein LOC126199245 [Schistocerca nitens]|uniref:uncharacterized protein LOC126199245 n=1 Tax=Schistocerca nitens TaxID=7011 RepID=UPI0021185BA0|nr:uncharacterized protein LOC126199245 [Schistocerca nitens]
MANGKGEIQQAYVQESDSSNNDIIKVTEGEDNVTVPGESEVHQKTYNFDDILTDISPESSGGIEDGFREFAVLLCGLGLTVDEIRLVKQRNIDIETFLALKETDLKIIGIEDEERRRKLIEDMQNLSSKQQPQENKAHMKSNSAISVQEGQQIVSLTATHLEELDLVLDTLLKAVAQNYDDTFVDEQYSSKAVLLVVLQLAMEQAYCLHNQLQKLPGELSQMRKQSDSRRAKYFSWKVVGLLVPATAVAVIAFWKMKKHLFSHIV